MRTASVQVNNILQSVERRDLVNNVQRVFLSLVNADGDGWVPRTALRVKSASARIRDLRKDEFGGFRVECASANDLNKSGRSKVTTRQTFYRIVPRSVTVSRVGKVLKGVI